METETLVAEPNALEAMQKLAAGMAPVAVPEPAPAPVAPVETEPAKTEPVAAEPVAAEPVAAPKTEVVQQPEAKPEELERALASLRRSKFPQKAIDALTPQELIALGSEHAKFWGEKDDNYRQLSELRKAKLEEKREDPNISAGTPQASTLFAEVAGDLGEVVTEKMGQSIERVLNAKLEAQAKAFQEQLETLSRAYQPLVVEHARAQLESARQRMVSKYDQLKDDAKFENVFKKMSAFDRTQYQTLDEMIDDASRIVFADDLARRAAVALETTKQSERQRDAGQPLTATSNREARKLSEMERATESMRLLSEGKMPDEIVKLLGS